MTKNNKSKPNDKEQSARFMEIAEQIQSENAQEAFEETMSKVAKKRKPTKS